MVIVLMGVSGAGKTTVAQLLASQLGWNFTDGDDYHSPANVEKMRNGSPLTDADRAPWLEALRALIANWIATGKNTVLACSALKQSYRQALLVGPEVEVKVKLVYLKATPQVLRQRLRERRGHFMSERLLASQLATLEAPQDAITVDADRSPAEIVIEIRARLALPE